MEETDRILDEYFSMERPCPTPMEIDVDIMDAVDELIDLMTQHEYWCGCLELCPKPEVLSNHFAEVLQRKRDKGEL
jgi:hypothetical protein